MNFIARHKIKLITILAVALSLLVLGFVFLRYFPLGNLNPPAHTFPTGHIYLYLKDAEKFGDVSSSEDISRGILDFRITFHACRQLKCESGFFQSNA